MLLPSTHIQCTATFWIIGQPIGTRSYHGPDRKLSFKKRRLFAAKSYVSSQKLKGRNHG